MLHRGQVGHQADVLRADGRQLPVTENWDKVISQLTLLVDPGPLRHAGGFHTKPGLGVVATGAAHMSIPADRRGLSLVAGTCRRDASTRRSPCSASWTRPGRRAGDAGHRVAARFVTGTQLPGRKVDASLMVRPV